MNVVTFLVSMLLVWGIRDAGPDRTCSGVAASGGPLGELVAGFGLLGRNPDLRSVTGAVAGQTFVGGAIRVLAGAALTHFDSAGQLVSGGLAAARIAEVHNRQVEHSKAVEIARPNWESLQGVPDAQRARL